MNPVSYRAPEGWPDAVACSECRYLHVGPDAWGWANRCCRCTEPGCSAPRRGGALRCDPHAEEWRQRREAERVAALTWVDDRGGPVEMNGHFYPDLGELLDAHERITDADVIYPCDVTRPAVPDLVEYVLEAWAGQFADPDGYFLPPEAEAILYGVMEALARHAPEVWVPRVGERVQVPADLLVDDAEEDG